MILNAWWNVDGLASSEVSWLPVRFIGTLGRGLYHAYELHLAVKFWYIQQHCWILYSIRISSYIPCRIFNKDAVVSTLYFQSDVSEIPKCDSPFCFATSLVQPTNYKTPGSWKYYPSWPSQNWPRLHGATMPGILLFQNSQCLGDWLMRETEGEKEETKKNKSQSKVNENHRCFFFFNLNCFRVSSWLIADGRVILKPFL